MNAAPKVACTPVATKSMIHAYPDTPHAFNTDYQPSFPKEQSEDGWKRCLAWFKENGVG